LIDVIAPIRDRYRRYEPAALALSRAPDRAGRQVVEDEVDAVLRPLVHDGVHLLVVDLVGLADLELVGRPSIMKRTRGFVMIGTWMRWPAPKDGCESRCGTMRPPRGASPPSRG
jgi:hypothetical protein